MSRRATVGQVSGTVLRARFVDVIVIVSAIAGIALAARTTCAHGRPVLGLVPGMTAEHVRAAFAPGTPGRFRVSSANETHVIAWRATHATTGTPVGARIELHDGMFAMLEVRFARGTGVGEARRVLGDAAGSLVSTEPDGTVVGRWRAPCTLGAP